MKKLFNFPILLFFIVVFSFFAPFFLQGKLPIPADTIIGLYHPFRDLYAKDYPNGIPYKNFLITDPVRQQFPWRELTISQEKEGSLPLWNPYNFSGTPLLASFQSAAFYPLNILFFILPFSLSWSILVVLQPALAGLFLYFYLRHMHLSQSASFLGSIVFAFCGFSTAWLEWNTLLQTALWLPLILLAKEHLLQKISLKWMAILIFSQLAAFFAGHLQTFFYLLLVYNGYLIARIIQITIKEKHTFDFFFAFKKYLPFIFQGIIVIIITAIQWIPTLQLINSSARNIDQMNWQQAEGWFIPWQHLIQFIVPDFFGNPSTLNYWGVWNYAEMIGYIGIAPLILSFFALFFRRDKKTLFFGAVFLFSLIFSLPTILAKLPYILNIPFLSTSQPTRLLFLADFSLSILAALGLDWFIRNKNKKYIILPIILIGLTFGVLWLFALQNFGENIFVAKRNLYLPTILFLTSSLIIAGTIFIKNKNILLVLLSLLLTTTIIDLIRFDQKFTPFTKKEYLFPDTKITSFLQKDASQFRIMTTDSRILPPNFSSVYRLQSVDGYDPLYLRRYAELIAASERGNPDIHPPFGFNRIITPQNTNSQIINLLGVKYILTFSDLPSPQFTKVIEEGQTKVYKNNQAFPRAFFVKNVKVVESKQDAINLLFDTSIDLHETAVVEESLLDTDIFAQGEVRSINYSDNKIVFKTTGSNTGFLVLMDTFYPTWHAKICQEDQSECKETEIYLTNYNFRGIVVPAGDHSIIFYNALL